MEALLAARTCHLCGGLFRFRLSRFGCVFSCSCGVHIDAVKAAMVFVKNLRTRGLPLPFLPLISTTTLRLTTALKVAVVQLDLEEEQVLVQFLNCEAGEIARIKGSLSLALQQQLVMNGGTFFCPSGLLDLLCEELQEVNQEPGLSFYVNAPDVSVTESAQIELASSEEVATAMERVPIALQRVLQKHQLDGVRKALAFQGRVLFADDMGVGKTLQALSTVAALEAYPLLIVCPSAVKYLWADQIEIYLHGQVSVDAIHMISGSNDALESSAQPKIVLVSYHMAATLGGQLSAREWKCIICDESHLLHTNISGDDASYTRLLTYMAKRSLYCLLLSGTPALSTPFDMFHQVDMLCPGLLGSSRWEFAMRYCQISFTPYLAISSSTRPVELASLLRKRCMIRRLKSEVLELPVKNRIVLRVADKSPLLEPRNFTMSFQERYSNSWKLKWCGIQSAVEFCCGKHKSTVFFAHHIALIDSLVKLLRGCNETVICIDGRVAPSVRAGLLRQFEKGEVKAAVVGITACAVGISFASAQCAVFCELPPDAAWMSQAEDRLHRPGQRGAVSIYYLLGVHSQFEREHFTHLRRSFRAARQITDEQNTDLCLSQVEYVSAQLPCNTSITDRDVVMLSCDTVPAEEALEFYISKNTGRLHIRAVDKPQFYYSMRLDEAHECIRTRNHPVWQQLAKFLESLAGESSFWQRQIISSGLWLPASFLRHRSHRSVSGKRNRYQRMDAIGWGLWWMVKRQHLPSHYYFCCLKEQQGAYYPVCLNCSVCCVVGGLTSEYYPGAIVVVEGDFQLFCCGRCREEFYTKRSSGAVRRAVAGLDRGICANCHIDCERLCELLASKITERERLDVLEKYHPQMLDFPALCRAVVNSPTPGNCWHADHIVPVAVGGGEASLDNIQTLCVACHALKTSEDMKWVKRILRDVKPMVSVLTSTVDCAQGKINAERCTRVTCRKEHCRDVE